MQSITVQKLTRAAFAEFGEVIDKDCEQKFPINRGNCLRHHDLATIEFDGQNARPIINIFEGQAYQMPYLLDMVERHPFGSQAFVPMHDRPFLVIVCSDENGVPVRPQAFVTEPNQGINFKKNTWHGVLTPLKEAGDFLVVDRDGNESNLEEHYFETPYSIEL